MQNFKSDIMISNSSLEKVRAKHVSFEVPELSFATVRDYCDSYDNLRSLATASGDLKDNQRPWMMKAIVSKVPRAGRVLEIGAGEPWEIGRASCRERV